MVLPPCTDQGISPYQGLVMPFNYRSDNHKLYFINNKAFFSNYCLNFLKNMIYILLGIFFMGIHYDYKSTKSAKLMEKQAKREKKLAEKKAKRLAKEGANKDGNKEKALDTSKPITLDFLTNPNKK